MAGPGNILIKIGAEAGQALRELGAVDKSLGATMTTGEKMGAGLKKAALPAAAALGAIAIAGADAAKAAMEDAAAQEHLAGVLQRVAGASEAQVAATEDWISGISSATGVADDQLRPALEKIATATGDVGSAQKLLGKALDISAASGKDLETVSVAIAKGYQGQTAALGKLVPGLDASARSSKDFNVIMKELGETTGGAMAAQAETATGQLAIMTNTTNELKESLGAALLPIIQAVLPLLNRMATFAAQNTTAIKVLVGAVAAVSAAILAANVAMKAYAAASAVVKAATTAWTAVQWLLNAALNANPIGLVVVALAALAAGIVIAYKRSETFREIVQAAFSALKSAANALASAFEFLLGKAQAAWNWIKSHWQVGLFAFGPIGAAVYLIITNFEKLQAVAESVAGAISRAIGTIADAINGVIGAVQSLIGWLSRIKVPKIDLPFGIGRAAPAGVMPAGVAAARAGPTATAGGVTVNVYGSLDPEGTARAILRVLGDRERRIGAR